MQRYLTRDRRDFAAVRDRLLERRLIKRLLAKPDESDKPDEPLERSSDGDR